MKIIMKLFVVVLVTIEFSCKFGNNKENKKAATESQTIANKPKEKPFANVRFASKRNTSCGMPLSAGLEDTVQVNEKIYGFCSKQCKDEFINILKIQKKR